MPVWSPDTRSLAYTSFSQGYPDLYRAFPFERRPAQTLAAYHGINSSPAWSPDGKTVAMTLSKDGNPEIYVLTRRDGHAAAPHAARRHRHGADVVADRAARSRSSRTATARRTCS